MKSIEIQNLDQHLKPLQVDGVSTGIELSTEGLRISSGELVIKNLTSETAKVDGDLTVDGNIQMTGESGTKINMYRDVYLEATSNDDYLEIGAKNIILQAATNYPDANAGIFIAANTNFDAHLSLMEGASVIWTIGHDATNNSLKFDSGVTVGGNTFFELSATALTIPNGDIVAGDDIAVAATGKLSLDSIGGHTYIHEDADDSLTFVVGGDSLFNLTEGASSKDKADFGTTSVGMTQGTVLYNATDTEVYFNRMGNKLFFTFGSGNVTDMNIRFPDMSGNFVLLVKQDGTGSRTVTNWKTLDQDGGNESTVKWAGGSAPTLTTTADKTDILSFYWDNTNHTGYGVATLNF